MLSSRLFTFRLSAVTTLVLLYGCANVPEKTSPPPPQPIHAPEVQAKPPAVLGQKIQPKDNATSIEPDVLFMLLTAELAGQRGQYDIALQGYMEAAKRVHDSRFAERAAMIALYLKDGKKLDESVKLWLRDDPNNVTARKFAALATLKAGDKTAAIGHIEALLKNDPAGFDKSLLELASVLQKDGNSSMLIDVLDAVSVRHPDQAMVYFVEALLATQMNRLDLAGDKVAQALRVQPNWDKALMLKAQLAMASGDLQAAKVVLTEASLKFPDDIKIKKLLAQVLVKSKNYDEAIKVYQALLKSNPKEHDTRLALGLMYLQQDNAEAGEEVLAPLLKEPEWQSQACYYLGKMAEQHNEIDKALVWYDKVKDPKMQFEAGVSAIGLLAREKRFAEADVRLGLLAESYPKQKTRILLIQSELLSQQKQYDKAFVLLGTILAGAPDDKDVLYAHALMAEHLGKLDVLEADLKKIIDQHPDNAEALNALGYTLADKTQRYQEADMYLQRALKVAPNEAVILDSYGWLQFKLGNKDKALDYLERAYGKQQENEIAAHLAEVLWVTGKQDKARKIFNEALKKSPDDRFLLDFKARILDKAD